jgi:hemolysin D
VIVVTRPERLARSTRDLLNILDAVGKQGAGFKSLRDTWADTTTPHGRLMLTVLGGLADTVGGVVTPAQSLLVIVPVDSDLEIEAMVSNRDIGFVHAGQEAEIKVETFNFTRYGLLHGRVLHVSQDAITRDKAQEKSNGKPPGPESSSTSEPKREELVYAARFSLDRKQMQIENKLANLSPGMAVTVKIKTGSRTVINYLLSPLLKYKQESFRER